jgi:hypothetical protein
MAANAGTSSTSVCTCAVRCSSWVGCTSDAKVAEDLVGVIGESDEKVAAALVAVAAVAAALADMVDVDLMAVGSPAAGVASLELGDAVREAEEAMREVLLAAGVVAMARASAREEGLAMSWSVGGAPEQARIVEGRVLAALGTAGFLQTHRAVVHSTAAMGAIKSCAGNLSAAAMAMPGNATASRAAVMAAQVMVRAATAEVAMVGASRAADWVNVVAKAAAPEFGCGRGRGRKRTARAITLASDAHCQQDL